MVRLGVVEIQIRNFNKSVEFYKKRLRLRLVVLEKEDRFAMFDTGEARLAVWAT